MFKKESLSIISLTILDEIFLSYSLNFFSKLTNHLRALSIESFVTSNIFFESIFTANDSFISKNIISKTGIDKILAKGRGAYYSSGSRPNQTPESWARARLASVIMNGPARKVDIDIWNKYKK